MILGNWGNDAHQRLLDNVGGIQNTAKTNLQNQIISWIVSKQAERNSGCRFKKRQFMSIIGFLNTLNRFQQRFIFNKPPCRSQPNPLIKANQMR